MFVKIKIQSTFVLQTTKLKDLSNKIIVTKNKMSNTKKQTL